MPLFARLLADHYLDRPTPRDESKYVGLSGTLEIGGFRFIADGPSAGTWIWGVSLTSSTGFAASGRAPEVEECCRQIGRAFREMLRRADLREVADAKPAPPQRDAVDHHESDQRSWSANDDGRSDRECGPMVRNERRVTVRSGELIVGLLERSVYGDESWAWLFDGGLRRPREDFVWRGTTAAESEAFDAICACWDQWCAWAGVEKIVPLQRGLRR